jgi:carbon-monoxide dehydrogenase medium subunit
MNLWQEYKRPTTIAEAIHELTSASGSVMPIAGGTDLLLDLKQGRQVPVHTLIDLTFIPEMNALELRGDELYVGAVVAVNRVALNPLVGIHAQALAEACNLIAGPQVRNMATLGGNIAHALPAADGTIALTALDAQAEVAGVAGMRRTPFTSLFISPGKSAINKSAEIIVGFYIPTHKTQKVFSKHTRNETPEAEIFRVSSCFKRIMRPQGVALPILNCAVWLKREKDIIKDIHIAVGPGGPTPFRATEAENVMRGQPLNEETIYHAIELLLAQVQFRTSARRASVDYRKNIVGGLFTDVLNCAWRRAK